MIWSNTFYALQDRDLNEFLDSQGLNLDQCWRSKYEGFPTSSDFPFKDAKWYLKLVASFIEWVLETLDASCSVRISPLQSWWSNMVWRVASDASNAF